MEVLQDKTGVLACLVDCQQKGDRLLCGVAIFRGGLRGFIEVSDNENAFFIEVPESVATNATHLILYNPETQYVEIKICPSKPQLESPESRKLLP